MCSERGFYSLFFWIVWEEIDDLVLVYRDRDVSFIGSSGMGSGGFVFVVFIFWY